MTRWLFGIAALPLTLLASGCLQMRSFRFDSSSPPAPAALTESPYAPIKPPEVLPTALAEPAAQSSPSPQKANPSTNTNWSLHTTPPPLIPARLPPLPREPVEPAANPIPPIDAAPKYPLVRALDCILDNRHDEALKHLQYYDASTQRFLLRMLPALSLFAKKPNLSPADFSALSVQMSGIMDELPEKSEFRISKMCFCETIKEFAMYKALPPDHEFVAALPGRVGERIKLYVEFKNFASQANTAEFESLLDCQVDIVDGKGKFVESVFEHEKYPLKVQKRLNEFYAKLEFSLKALPPGWYELRVEIRDETPAGAGRSDRRSLPFRVAAP